MHLKHSSSETSLVEEQQPFWFDELLDEPVTPAHTGHRRSSSDSFTYLSARAKALNNREECKVKNAVFPSRTNKNFDHSKDFCDASFNTEVRSSHRQQQYKELDKQHSVVSSSCILEGTSENNSSKATVNRRDSKRANRQYNHRSQVRQLQYVAELERHAQVLQGGGVQVSAELRFLDQQYLILGMENRALTQQLDSLAQEQHIKYLERDLLQREIRRLQALYQQHQHQGSKRRSLQFSI